MLQLQSRTAAKRSGQLRPRFVDECQQEVTRTVKAAAGSGPSCLSKRPSLMKKKQSQQPQQPQQPKLNTSCLFELPLNSTESKAADSTEGKPETESSGDTDCEASCEVNSRSSGLMAQWKQLQPEFPLPIYQYCGEFQMTSNSLDKNNSGQGVDMQNLPSVAEQLEKQRTWMTVFFRYRMNWYEAKPTLEKMSREVAHKSSNLPLWTRYVKVQLHRKTIFLNAVRAFRNRMQCATSGVRFTMNAFYRESDYRRVANESRDGPESKPLPYFRIPDEMPEIKTMVVAQMNVFVSNSTSYFDQFWEQSLQESN